MSTPTHWANRYLERKIDALDRDATGAAAAGFEPEASEYMDDLAAFDAADLAPEHRVAYLEATVRAVVAAMENEENVAERDCGVRRAVAYGSDDPIVGVLEGFGELISLDRETAALLAFAYHLEPEPTTAEGKPTEGTTRTTGPNGGDDGNGRDGTDGE